MVHTSGSLSSFSENQLLVTRYNKLEVYKGRTGIVYIVYYVERRTFGSSLGFSPFTECYFCNERES